MVRTFRAAAVSRGGGGHGPPPPAFARTLPPNGPLPEDHDLIWDDGVAAEPCLDFDAPHISKEEGLAWFLGGLGFFFSFYQLIKFSDPPGKNPVNPRTILTDNFGGTGQGLLDHDDDD
ncbi:hypothetical protein CTAYLR_001612 [Chrysophaeum taylorii]|uniref:Uncharacterized protein n=1 Tax=Chrysophaeum taylorii TaxID=2483200 RepID=A0AAD7UED1_9STRA|nr:hypothetical protein CTAYLR_001612 [Chrysophaeum taylorii]